MSQPSTQFTIPPISSIYTFVLVMASLTMLLLPMPPFWLDFFITLNFILALLLLCIALYTHKLSTVASLAPILGLSVFFRFCLSLAIYRCFFAYGYLLKNHWHITDDLITALKPMYLGSFISFTGGGNLVWTAIVSPLICLFPVLAFPLILIASNFFTAKAEPTLKDQAQHPDHNISADHDDSQSYRVFHTLRGASILLGIEALIGLCVAIGFGSSSIDLEARAQSANIQLFDLPLHGNLIILTPKLLSLCLMLGNEALIRGIPLTLICLALWLLLSREDTKAQSLGEQFMETLTLHPYSLLFASAVLALMAIFNLFLGLPFPWYVFLPISGILVSIAFSVFLAADVQEQLVHYTQALEKRKALLGLPLETQIASSITLEVSDALSRHFHLHYIESVKMEDLKNHPPRPEIPLKSWQGLNDYLTWFKRRIKFMQSVHLCLKAEEGTGSKLLRQLQVLYKNLEKELDNPITPVQIQISDTLMNGQYRILASGKTQTNGEIPLSEDEALNNKAIQELIQQLKTALINVNK